MNYQTFTDTIRTTLNSFSTLIRQDLIIGRIVIMIGDDNSDCFKGTWNTDFSVKTVTRATGSIASPISACDLVFFAQNNLQNDSSTGVYYSNGKIGVISAVTNNFKPSIDKPIPTLVYYNYRNFSNPSYYYWYQNRSVLTNLSVLNGTYNFTFDFDYLGKHYSIKKRMIISYQFTDTIRANFDNFNSKLSIPINIKNYDDINISNVENYYCNGNSLTFQPHIYNYKIAYWRVVKSIEIEISGQADDYAQVIVNNSITVHPNLQDTLGIKDGIYIWGKTQSSDYVKEKHPFTMTNENLNIQFGTVNTLPTVCFLKASLKIRLFFQFTDTVTPTLKSLGSFNNSLKIVLKTVFTTRISNIISDTGRCEGYCYWEYDVVSLNASILSNPENYAKAVAEFSIYGKADDGFKFYLNGTNITTFASVCNHGSCTSKSDWIPSLHSFEYSLTSKTNNLLIKAYSIKNDYWAEIYSAILTIKTESKQFTDTIKVLCNNASKQILISKPFTAPTSTSERCRQYGYYYGIPIEDFVGSSGAASQTKTFTASDFLYPEHIKKYEVKFACGNGTCVFKINGEIKYQKTLCSTCPDRSSGITVSMPVTISSSSSLNSGFAQSAFRVCAFYQVYRHYNL